MPIALGLIWGFVWAAFMQFTKVGWFISTKQTWLGVVLGVGGNLLIARRFIDKKAWETMAAITAASAMGVGCRSLYNQQKFIEKEKQSIWESFGEND